MPCRGERSKVFQDLLGGHKVHSPDGSPILRVSRKDEGDQWEIDAVEFEPSTLRV